MKASRSRRRRRRCQSLSSSDLQTYRLQSLHGAIKFNVVYHILEKWDEVSSTRRECTVHWRHCGCLQTHTQLYVLQILVKPKCLVPLNSMVKSATIAYCDRRNRYISVVRSRFECSGAHMTDVHWRDMLVKKGHASCTAGAHHRGHDYPRFVLNLIEFSGNDFPCGDFSFKTMHRYTTDTFRAFALTESREK